MEITKYVEEKENDTAYENMWIYCNFLSNSGLLCSSFLDS